MQNLEFVQNVSFVQYTETGVACDKSQSRILFVRSKYRVTGVLTCFLVPFRVKA